MRTHRGSLLVTLTVLLLASTPGSVRGQSPQGERDGTPLRPPQGAGPPALGAVPPQMPLAAAPSMLGPGQPLPNPQLPPTAYLPMGYGYAGAGYGYAPTMPGYGGVYPASYTGDGSGAPQPLPMEDAAPMGGEGSYSGDYMSPGGECEYCSGEGCTHCLGLASFLSSGLSWLLPFSEGGCCAPRWYDVTVDYMYLRRDNVSSHVDFTSEGVLGDIVLSTDNLDFDWRSGLRFTGAVQALVGGSLEFTYFGLVNWSSNANVSDPNGDLFSVISDFGTRSATPVRVRRDRSLEVPIDRLFVVDRQLRAAFPQTLGRPELPTAGIVAGRRSLRVPAGGLRVLHAGR